MLAFIAIGYLLSLAVGFEPFRKFSTIAIFLFYVIHIIAWTLKLVVLHYGRLNYIKRFLSMHFWVIFERLGLQLVAGHVLILKWYFLTKQEVNELTIIEFVS